MTSTSASSDADWSPSLPDSASPCSDGRREGEHVIVLEGEIDMLTASALVDPIERLEPSAPRTVVLDFERVTFIDSTGLSGLIVADRAARATGRRLVLRAVSPRVLRVLQVTQLDRALAVEQG